MTNWYTRPVLGVGDADAALAFYSSKLGFGEDWRYEEEGQLRIVQVSRAGCDLILSEQWPEQVGHGLLFIELDQGEYDGLLAECRERGLDVKSGWWGYDLAVIEDPDGNRLWFPNPSDAGAES